MLPDHNGWAIILGPSGSTRFTVKRIKNIPAYRVDRLYEALHTTPWQSRPLDHRPLPLGQLPDSRTPSISHTSQFSNSNYP
ncbi:hypothetical protein N7493_009893 [Penicillium malachiteum]|uniref:Uncharacterized protein n=1 Tax=Penicillium malachiteum TaxID=1324776 RepID=A0AAD6HDP4_9EURO|nr:hypothetical protein N7493_009893 [Penicillium malachiteum]